MHQPHFPATLLNRRAGCAALLGISVLAAAPALAHHGWAWAEGGNTELTGVVTAVRLGNPHGELTLDVDGVPWTVEVGQPWRNERAGLDAQRLAKGVKLTVSGHRHADPARKVFKAERVIIDRRRHDLYPDRD